MSTRIDRDGQAPFCGADHVAVSFDAQGRRRRKGYLDGQAGEARLAEVFRKAGLTRFRRAAETPFNLILEARR